MIGSNKFRKMHLEKKINRVSHDMAHWEDSYHEGSRKAELERSLLQESSHLSLQQLNDKGRKHDRE